MASSCMFLCFLFFISLVSAEQSWNGTIIFTSYRRMRFAFDIFSVEIPSQLGHGLQVSETRLTFGDGTVINHNGFFTKEALHKHLVDDGVLSHESSYRVSSSRSFLQGKALAYVSEREGISQIYFNLYSNMSQKDGFRQVYDDIHEYKLNTMNLRTENIDEVKIEGFEEQIFLQDRPSLAQDCVIYMSTQEKPLSSRESWVAVYSTNLTTGETWRLSPIGVADFSPAVSPSGEWVLVASFGDRPWQGEAQGLNTDLYILSACDGSHRKLLVSNAGWPSWADDSTFFFHRKAEDGWWAVFKGTISEEILHSDQDNVVVSVERVTPAGVHCFTPAASANKNWIAVATRRPGVAFRHIEIYDLVLQQFYPVTNKTAPYTNHYNPFVSHDSAILGYHKCRGGLLSIYKVDNQDMPISNMRIIMEGNQPKDKLQTVPHLDHLRSPFTGLSLLRTEGEFPSISPDGSLIAYIPLAGETGIHVMLSDGSRSTEVYAERSFGTTWDPKREGVIYTSSGPIFRSRLSAHVVAIYNVHQLVNGEDLQLVSKRLTKEGTRNNAFPWPSPDGKYLVFRSSRSGSKNLYIMDAEQGEEGGLWRLTDGKWTDTMCSWSPDGQWISFSSDRENPGNGRFSLYVIHPNGTGLRKVFNNTNIIGGRVNHAMFSPDSKSLVFTTDYASVSVDPISIPLQFQPQADIFVVSLDGSKLERMTHSPFENGTPHWGKTLNTPLGLSSEGENVQCSFEDVDLLEQENISVKQQTKSLQIPCSAAATGLAAPW